MATALVILADPGNPEANGRMVHLLTAAATLAEAGENVSIYFHGAGVNWAGEFVTGESRFAQAYGEKFDALKPLMAGACSFCTSVRFDQAEAMAELGIGILGADGEHHTVAELLLSGDRVVTF